MSNPFFNVQPHVRPFFNIDGSTSKYCINSNEGLALNKNYIYPADKRSTPQTVFDAERIPARLLQKSKNKSVSPNPSNKQEAYDYEVYLRYIKFKKNSQGRKQ